MRKIITPLLAAIVALTSCSKEALRVDNTTKSKLDNPVSMDAARSAEAEAKNSIYPYKLYTIGTGKHTCDQNDLKFVSLSQLRFAVIFDNSAIYTTTSPGNQNDINMLYGFSEGPALQVNSARIGWSYNSAGGGAPSLKLYAYAYINGVPEYKLITPIPITTYPATTIKCSIELSGHNYIFKAYNQEVTLPRASASYDTQGFLLYPYFGGTETAPHRIKIKIKNL